jgi:hypothetical protein
VAGRSGGPKRVTQILLDVPATQPELARNGRHGSRLAGEQRHQIFPEHGPNFTRLALCRLCGRAAREIGNPGLTAENGRIPLVSPLASQVLRSSM